MRKDRNVIASSADDGQQQEPQEQPPYDLVNEPPHYAGLNPQPLDVIEAWELDFHLGQVLKYVARAGKKVGSPYLQDLKKARFYLDRKIAKLGDK